MIRRSIHERAIALRAIPPLRDLCLRSQPIRTIGTDDRGRHVEAFVSVSALGNARLIDDLDVRGEWPVRREAADGWNVTAMLMGDPVPGRSALDQREARNG